MIKLPKVPKSHVPADLLLRHRRDPIQTSWPGGGTPGGGDGIVPHIFTVAGRYGVASKVYSYGDEALMDSRENAELMRNELAIMECVEARKRSTSLLSWHVGPADEGLDAVTRERLKISAQSSGNRWDAEELAAKVSLILSRTPNLTKLFDSLMDGIWYGRYGTEQYFGSTAIQGLSNRAMYIKRWEPRHGDKIVFRYDDGTKDYDPEQIGIRIGPGYNVQKTFKDYAGNEYNKVEATMFGLAYFLDGAERKKMAVHKHIIEDGDFNHPLKAGSIHGVGIRSRIYWSWYAYSESLKLLMEYMERSALGIEIWRYPAHNPKAKAAAEEAAANRGAPGRSVLMVPVPEGEQAGLYDVEIVEPGLQGIDALQNVLDKFYGHKMKRYILGQTLTTEADATGMGSGVADAHQATYADIVRFDSLGLAETITHEIVRVIQLLNFPGSEGIFLKFSFDTESPQMQFKLDAYRQAWEMGAEIKTDDIFRTLGAARPNEDDDVLQNPAFMQQSMDPGMMDLGAMDAQGQPMDPNADPAMAQDMLAPVEQAVYSAPIESRPIQVPTEYEPKSAIERYSAPYRAKTNHNPSKAQIEAGNYAKRLVNWKGLRISIENEKGTSRKEGWKPLSCDYGYIKQTTGADGDHVDCFVGSDLESELVVVVDQVGAKGVRFDEHKVLIGFTNRAAAKAAYMACYPKGWKCGPTTGMTIDQFKSWLKDGNQKHRVGNQVSRYAWDESQHERESTAHDGKRPGEFAAKSEGKRESVNFNTKNHSKIGKHLKKIGKSNEFIHPLKDIKDLLPSTLTHDDQHLIAISAGIAGNQDLESQVHGEDYDPYVDLKEQNTGDWIRNFARAMRNSSDTRKRAAFDKRVKGASTVLMHDPNNPASRKVLHKAVRQDRGENEWQLTRMDERGPVGHSNHMTFEEGLYNALGFGKGYFNEARGHEIAWTDKDGTASPFSAQTVAQIQRYANQGSLWNEDDHERETTAHDGKRPGEFAPKQQGGLFGDLGPAKDQKGMFGEDYVAGKYDRDEFRQLTGQAQHEQIKKDFGMDGKSKAKLKPAAKPGRKIEDIDDTRKNDDFEARRTFKTEGGQLRLAKNPYSQTDWSVLETYVDEDMRRQGIASDLVAKATQSLEGTIGAQASSDGSVALFWKHGFRLADGGTIEDAMATRAENSSVNLIHPGNSKAEPEAKGKTGNMFANELSKMVMANKRVTMTEKNPGPGSSSFEFEIRNDGDIKAEVALIDGQWHMKDFGGFSFNEPVSEPVGNAQQAYEALENKGVFDSEPDEDSSQYRYGDGDYAADDSPDTDADFSYDTRQQPRDNTWGGRDHYSAAGNNNQTSLWSEDDHPRNPKGKGGGQFTSKGKGESSPAAKYFEGAGMIDNLNAAEKHYVEALLEGTPEGQRDAKAFFEGAGMLEQMSGDAKKYVQDMLDAIEPEPAKEVSADFPEWTQENRVARQHEKANVATKAKPDKAKVQRQQADAYVNDMLGKDHPASRYMHSANGLYEIGPNEGLNSVLKKMIDVKQDRRRELDNEPGRRLKYGNDYRDLSQVARNARSLIEQNQFDSSGSTDKKFKAMVNKVKGQLAVALVAEMAYNRDLNTMQRESPYSILERIGGYSKDWNKIKKSLKTKDQDERSARQEKWTGRQGKAFASQLANMTDKEFDKAYEKHHDKAAGRNMSDADFHEHQLKGDIFGKEIDRRQEASDEASGKNEAKRQIGMKLDSMSETSIDVDDVMVYYDGDIDQAIEDAKHDLGDRDQRQQPRDNTFGGRD